MKYFNLKKLISNFNLFCCPICEQKNNTYYNDLCETCKNSLHFIEIENSCYACGGDLDGILGICSKCIREKKRSYIKAISILRYKKFDSRMLSLFKSGLSSELARFLADIAYDRMKNEDLNFDLIIPIPLHWKRRSRRSYNQSELVARQLAKKMSVKFSNRAIKRTTFTKTQKSSTGEERRQNLKNAFKVNPKIVKNKNILIIDDIFTTGSTLDNAAKELKKAGASIIFVLSLARA